MRLLLLTLAFIAAPVLAQAWPAKAVRFIVPFPPGGSTDVAARTLADKLTRALGQVVKNVQFDMQRDFSAVTQVTTQPIAVAVHSALPVKSVQELVAYARPIRASCPSPIRAPAAGSTCRGSC